jgi:Zn finger protein HypA/HybF involved in hydrogenase expression
MIKCKKCSNLIEQKAKQLFCYYCKGYKMPYETYKFYSLANQFENK